MWIGTTTTATLVILFGRFTRSPCEERGMKNLRKYLKVKSKKFFGCFFNHYYIGGAEEKHLLQAIFLSFFFVCNELMRIFVASFGAFCPFMRQMDSRENK